jgi:dTDP-4-dehydrorhamnose 3,5-epimerase
MGHFTLQLGALDGLGIIGMRPLADTRGHLMRLFCEEELRPLGWRGQVVQANHTLTRDKGTVRGMHFQNPPHGETKIVTCLSGEVLDVAVDLRAGSPTFLRWAGIVLSENNRRAYYIPEGFAHGFQTLSENVQMLYFHSAAYAPESEGGLNPLDPGLNIDWPLPVGTLSERDKNLPSAGDFGGIPQ